MGGLTRSQPRALAYAQITANQTLISTLADITGLSITFTAGVRPIWVELFIPAIQQVTSAGTTIVYISTSANDAVEYATHDALAAGQIGPVIVKRRLTILTPGTAYTMKGRAATSAGTMTVRANTDTIPTVNGPAYLRAFEE